MLYRLFRLIIKELQAILGNRQGRAMLIMPVLLQTAVFPFAATLEVKNNTLAIYNQDNGAAALEIVQRLSQISAFSQLHMVHNQDQLQAEIDTQSALVALQIPADFSRKLQAKQGSTLQIIFDGRRSNSGQIASSDVLQVVAKYSQEQGAQGLAQLNVRNIYNPNLNFKWHVLPSLVAIITTIGCLVVTALSVAREREEGTFDQLLVSPLTPAYIMAGKAIPGILVALFQGSVIAGVAHFIYQVPFTGSLPLLMLGMLCYGLALAGVGLFLSSLCMTQQQAFLAVFSFMVPAIMLSGYVSPMENMPQILQYIAHINPLTYFIRILKGVFLKELGLIEAWDFMWPLLLIGFCSLGFALAMFRRHIA